MTSYQVAWTGEQPLLTVYLQTERAIFHRNVLGNQITDTVVWGTGKGKEECYLLTADVQGPIYADGKKLLQGKQRKNILKDNKMVVDRYWKVIKSIRRAASGQVSQKDMLSLFQQWCAIVREILAYFMWTQDEVMASVQERLGSLLKQKYEKKWEEMLVILTTPVQHDIIYEEKTDSLKVKRDPTGQKVKEHMLKYSFMLYNIYSEKEAAEAMKKRMESYSFDEIEKEIRKVIKNKKELKKKQEKLLKRVKSREIHALSSFICQAILARLAVKASWGGSIYYALPLFEKIARQANLSTDDLGRYFTREEIEGFLSESHGWSKEVVRKRKEMYFLRFHAGKIRIYSGAEAQDIKSKVLDQSLPKDDITEFTGAIACKGRVKGQVLWVKVEALGDIVKIAERVKPDSILVAGMTNPNMMVLVRKVKGIVTDEGGMACHAAIVSREYNIPCLVGCRIATQVLKDGDLIELDATKGIVKLLKRA